MDKRLTVIAALCLRAPLARTLSIRLPNMIMMRELRSLVDSPIKELWFLSFRECLCLATLSMEDCSILK